MYVISKKCIVSLLFSNGHSIAVRDVLYRTASSETLCVTTILTKSLRFSQLSFLQLKKILNVCFFSVTVQFSQKAAAIIVSGLFRFSLFFEKQRATFTFAMIIFLLF